MMEEILNLRYVLDTFYFLVSGALVVWLLSSLTPMLLLPMCGCNYR